MVVVDDATMDDGRRDDFPAWWEWELQVSSHLLKRMVERGFSETDLRCMLDAVAGIREDRELGRWAVLTSHESRPWKLILEPDTIDRVVVVITAFPIDPT